MLNKSIYLLGLLLVLLCKHEPVNFILPEGDYTMTTDGLYITVNITHVSGNLYHPRLVSYDSHKIDTLLISHKNVTLSDFVCAASCANDSFFTEQTRIHFFDMKIGDDACPSIRGKYTTSVWLAPCHMCQSRLVVDTGDVLFLKDQCSE